MMVRIQIAERSIFAGLCILQMEEIVRKFGMVVCSRSGSDIDKFIYESDLLTKYKVIKAMNSSSGVATPDFLNCFA